MNLNSNFSAKERRRFKRYGTLGLITVLPKNSSSTVEGKVFNVSEGGMSFATDLPLNLMSPVDIKVEHSPDMPQNERYTGKVLWRMRTNDLYSGAYRYGIEFAYQKDQSEIYNFQ